ncbi:hypothetical protein LSTR_LSTR008991 [Laodelphax striatellus]|uniref:BED-type domain-containing protein n=1 Tax=Laodelphax striatellus TaxID=195883 RepID=A0A482WXN7_LAOST|nr:hypothetical protein LSTR_LSTR008991 [Laodelphax striatellus]
MEQTDSQSDSLDLVLPSASPTSDVIEKDENEQLSEKGNSNSQSDGEVSLTEKDNNSSDGNPQSPSQVEKDSLQSVADDDQQNSSNSLDNSTKKSSENSSSTTADKNQDQNIDASLHQIKDENSATSPSSLSEESGVDLEKSDKVLAEPDNAHKESGNVLEESENVLEEFLTLKTPDETSSNLPGENPVAQRKKDSNSCDNSGKNQVSTDTATNDDIPTNSKNNEEANSSYDSASQLLFDIVRPDKSSANSEINKKCMNQPDKQQNDEMSSDIAGDSSAANTVEQDLCALFSDSPSNGNSQIINSERQPSKTTPSNDGNSSEGVLRNKNLQIKDVVTCKENVCELNTSIKDESSTIDSVKDSNILVENEFNTHQIEIKEEIESVWFENSNSFENDGSTDSYLSDHDQLQEMIELCRKECFVVLERCDDSLLNVANPYKSDVKIVSVESLSSLNMTKKHEIVWSYFIKRTPTLAECKICGRTLFHKKLYNLTRHLQVVHDHSSSNKEPYEPHKPAVTLKKGQSSSANASTSKPVSDPAMFKQQPMNYFSFVNSQTARCVLCSQYMPYRCLDDLAILKSHLLLKHSDSGNTKKSAKAENTVSSDKSSDDGEEEDEEEEEEEEEEEDDDDDNEEETGSGSGRMPRQRTWSHFTKLERGLAQCNTCFKRFSYGLGDLRKLTRHLKIGHGGKKPVEQPKRKAGRPRKTQVLKEKPNLPATSKSSNLSKQPPTGKQFLEYFSFMRSDNALCKKCNTKVPYSKKNTKSLHDHYNKCTPDLANAARKRASKRRKVLTTDIDEDESTNDPDFVPSDFEDQPQPSKHKTQLMAAVELSPKDNVDWNHFKKLNGSMVQCVHCSKKLSFKKGDTWLLEQHLQLWHGKNALKKSKDDDDACSANLDDIPLLFRLKNQPKPYTLGDCYYRKKLQYNLSEIGRYFRRLGNTKLICKLCSQHLNCNETSTEVLMSHVLQEHVRKLFKPRPDEANTAEATQSPAKQAAGKMKSTAPTMQKALAQSTPRPAAATRPRAAKPKATLPQLFAEPSETELQLVSKSTFTMKYFLEFGANRQQCKLCNRQFAGKKSSNVTLLSQHLLSTHLKNVVDDETQLSKSGENEQRKAIIKCTRRRIVNKFSKIDNSKISCKMCSSHIENGSFETMKSHLLENHQKYLITILKEVKRVLNYNCTDLRKTKKLLTIRKKRGLRAKCSLCSRDVRYAVGNTKHLFNHLLKLHKTLVSKISVSKLKVWKYFTKKKYGESKCEICSKFISSKIHCNHKVPKLFCLSTGLKSKPKKESTMNPETKSTELKVKDKSSSKSACFYFTALKQYNSECIFCSKSLKSANKIICKIACRFNHGNEYINWLYKNDPVDKTFISENQANKSGQKTLSLLEMFEDLKNKKMNTIKLWYSEFSNKYHCNLCSDNISAKYLRFSLYFDHALVEHKGLLSMHRALVRPLDQSSGVPPPLTPPPPQAAAKKTITKSPIPKNSLKNTKLVKVKLWHHFKVIGSETACCNFCKTNLRYSATNVDNLSTHLRVQHLNDLLKLSEQPVNSSPTPPARTPLKSSLPTTTANKNETRVQKSGTWNYFSESNKGAICKLCGKQFLFSDKANEAPLTRHLQLVHNIALSQDNRPPPPPRAVPNQTIQSDASKEQQTKWAWQYFEKDDVRPSTAKCKLCAIYCSCIDEQGDLASVLLKHLRLVHNKWLVNVGNKLLQNNLSTPAKRKADTDVGAKSSPGQSQKKVKFDDSINDVTTIDSDNEIPTPTTPTPKKSPTPSKNSQTKPPGQGTTFKSKKALKRFQELENKKSKKSLVWTYFTPIEGQPDFSRCNVCSKSISSKFGISILRTHLRVKHNILIVNMNQYSELKKSIGDTSLTNALTGTPSAKTLSSGEKQADSPNKANNLNLKSPALSNQDKFDKRHPVWSYFKEERNSNLLKCNLCSVYLSCKSEKAEGLQNHLSAKHNIVFLEADPLKNVSPNKSLPGTPTTKNANQIVQKKQTVVEQTPMTAKELYETTTVEESIVENEVFYTTEENLVTVTERGDPSADETVHYEIVETTQPAIETEVESTDIVKVITELLPSYSVGISDDVNATEISPQESDLISNIVTSLSNPGDQTTTQAIIDSDQLKSIAVLTGETEDTSLAWDFYVKLADNKVKCDVCSEVFTYENKESANLTEHIQSKHPAELAQYKLSRLGFSDSCIIVVKNPN